MTTGKKQTALIGTALFVAAVSVMNADEIKVEDVKSKYAMDPDIKASKELKQNINLGFANTTGNTETLNLNAKYDLSYTIPGYNGYDLAWVFDTSIYVTQNDGETDNEEYTANLSLEQQLTESGWLAYGSVRWLRNTFRNFDSKLLIGAGVGKELYNDGKQRFEIKLGGAYNLEQYSNQQPDHDFASLTEYMEYNNQLNKTSLLYVKVGASENFDDFNDYEVLSVIGFTFDVAEKLSVTLEGEVRYDNIPPVGYDTTDTKSIVRIGYSF
jgi:putative salt-induced outer membrane protein YdiY